MIWYVKTNGKFRGGVIIVKVVLYGFGKLGKRVYASLINNKDIELVGIVDNAVSEGGGEKC